MSEPQTEHQPRGAESVPLTADPRRRGDTGAVAEMLVCVDLLRRGYAIFRAVSPQCPCDLIAMAGGRCWRVEVRTGRLNPPTGRVGVSVRETDHFDILAVVVGNDVGYVPDTLTPGEELPWPLTPETINRALMIARG